MTTEQELDRMKELAALAALEIEEHWEAHCDAEGYGPINLIDRLSGRLGPKNEHYERLHTDLVVRADTLECRCRGVR